MEYRALEDTPVALSFGYRDDHVFDDPALCEQLFEQTNTYRGLCFTLLQPGLEATREAGPHHTALGIGDHITIDGRT